MGPGDTLEGGAGVWNWVIIQAYGPLVVHDDAVRFADQIKRLARRRCRLLPVVPVGENRPRRREVAAR